MRGFPTAFRFLRSRSAVALCLVASGLVGPAGCGPWAEPSKKTVISPGAGGAGMPIPPRPSDRAAGDAPGIHNLVAFHAGLISGSVPEGPSGFDSLQGLGVRTVVSVDGAVPDVAAARRRGMRYIHLPIGYDGFDEDRRLQLTRAVLDGLADGPVYIHCHHGVHRSAGAAAAVAVGAGWSTPEAGIARMRVSGTSPRYAGLFECVERSTRFDPEQLEAVDADFPEIDRPDDFVDAMIRMDETLDHLRLIGDAGWKVPETHPDLVPAAEAGRLANLLRITAQGPRAIEEKDEDFGRRLARDARRVAELEELLLAETVDIAALDRSLAAVRASCISCHRSHRD